MRSCFALALMALCVVGSAVTTSAELSSSTSYTLDSSVGGSFGGQTSSANYALTSVGGESVMGNGSGGSYLLGEGYTSRIDDSIQLLAQPDGLKAYYRLNAKSGIVANDWTTYDHPARRDSTTPITWTDDSYNADGAFDQAASSAYVATSSAPLTTVSNFSVTGFFKPTSVGTDVTLAAQDSYSGSGDAWNLSLNTAGKVVFSVQKAGVSTQVTSAQTLTAGMWAALVATYDGAKLSLYIDGTLDAQQAYSGGSLTFTQQFAIGSRTNSTNPHYFSGIIDDVALYDRALSATEANALYAADVTLASLGRITPGVSSSSGLQVVVQTSAPSYTLNTRRYGASGIPSISGTIAAPASWSEGTTKGLGFTVAAAPTTPDAKWGTNPNYSYAAFPTSSTTFYSRSGYTGGVKDVVTLQMRADVASGTTPGDRSILLDLTGTTLP